MENRSHIKDEQRLIYNIKLWHKKDTFDILKNISEYVTLVQLMDSLVNLNHDISMVGYCIFDSNYKKVLCMTKESLDIICSPSFGEEQVATLQSVFYSVRFIWESVNTKKGKHEEVSKITIHENKN